MPDYSPQEIVDMIKLVGEARDNYSKAADLYAERYPDRRRPFRTTIKRLCERANGGKMKRQRQKSGSNEATTVAVVAAAAVNPHVSTRQIEREHGIPKSTANRILRTNRFHPYHIQLVHGLVPNDYPRRLQFCNWMQARIGADPTFVEKVLFSDEATFTNRGGVNRHNMHYYSDVNPHWYRHQEFQRQWSINVWAGIVGDTVIGPYFFEEHLNGANYLNFLRTELPDLLQNVLLNARPGIWFQQDGAPAHRSRQVTAFLNDHFPNRWIGIGSTICVWPPRSPDLTPLDYFLWGFVKERVFLTEPTTIENMKDRIRNAFEEITPEVLQRVRASFQMRLTQCIQVNGGVFEHLR